jgi:hypothetical protein
MRIGLRREGARVELTVAGGAAPSAILEGSGLRAFVREVVRDPQNVHRLRLLRSSRGGENASPIRTDRGLVRWVERMLDVGVLRIEREAPPRLPSYALTKPAEAAPPPPPPKPPPRPAPKRAPQSRRAKGNTAVPAKAFKEASKDGAPMVCKGPCEACGQM